MQLTVAPDYLPPHFGAWYLISGLVGQETGRPVRLHMPGDTRELEDTLARQQEGIAYVNSFSASRLIREQGWIPLLKPAAGSDETVIICRADAPPTAACATCSRIAASSAPTKTCTSSACAYSKASASTKTTSCFTAKNRKKPSSPPCSTAKPAAAF